MKNSSISSPTLSVLVHASVSGLNTIARILESKDLLPSDVWQPCKSSFFEAIQSCMGSLPAHRADAALMETSGKLLPSSGTSLTLWEVAETLCKQFLILVRRVDLRVLQIPIPEFARLVDSFESCWCSMSKAKKHAAGNALLLIAVFCEVAVLFVLLIDVRRVAGSPTDMVISGLRSTRLALLQTVRLSVHRNAMAGQMRISRSYRLAKAVLESVVVGLDAAPAPQTETMMATEDAASEGLDAQWDVLSEQVAAVLQLRLPKKILRLVGTRAEKMRLISIAIECLQLSQPSPAGLSASGLLFRHVSPKDEIDVSDLLRMRFAPLPSDESFYFAGLAQFDAETDDLPLDCRETIFSSVMACMAEIERTLSHQLQQFQAFQTQQREQQQQQQQ